MPISPNSLFHFTKGKEIVQQIILEGFKVKPCREQIFAPITGSFLQYVPMVSFCDIPLSQIKDHTKRYGNYGIGLTKEWAIKKGLNPVLYIDKNSSLTENLRMALIHQMKQLGEGLIKWKDVDINIRRLFDMIRYIKNYEAGLIRNGKVEQEDYRFYDEREWRYVPDIEDFETMFYVDANYTTDKQKTNALKQLERFNLKFDIADIKYLIVQNESEVLELIEWCRHFLNEPESSMLTSRITTTEHILSDF